MTLDHHVKPSVLITILLLLMFTSTFAIGADGAAPAKAPKVAAPAPAQKAAVPAKKTAVPAPTVKAAVPAPAQKVVEPLLQPDTNLDISFFIVEHTDETGNSHRFSADKVQASSGNNVQDFSMLFSTILPEREIGQVSGVFRIGEELWEFGVDSVVKIGTGRLIVNTKLSVKDKQKGSTELISKEPYRTTKVIGNKEQNVTEFIDVGVKIEAQPTIQKNGLVYSIMKMSISEVLRENDRSRETRVPIVSFRTVNTSMDFEPGKLEVLSELTIQKTVKQDAGLPYLRNIPYLGKLLFTHSSEELVDTKLYIVGGVSAPQGEMIKKYEALKKKVEADQGQLPKFK